VLFPRLAPGGQYLIEDWCWAHNDASSDIKRFRGKTPLSVLLFELMLVCAHRPMLIEEVVIKKGLAIVRRGPEEIDPTSFDVSTSFGDAGQALVRNLRGA
jgi:hypothetical protein